MEVLIVLVLLWILKRSAVTFGPSRPRRNLNITDKRGIGSVDLNDDRYGW